MKHPTQRAGGFTLIEMVVTLALVSMLAMTALPLYQVTTTRLKETELRTALRTIRTALDAYKAASDQGQIPKAPGESGFPPTLDALVQGVEITVPNATTIGGEPAKRRIVFLRRVPRDPFVSDPNVSAADTWALRAYGSSLDDPQPGPDIYDVLSKSPRVGLNGIPYRQW